jgi:UDP:flavonoid glycosyltransferase YjiC (YdhE family)
MASFLFWISPEPGHILPTIELSLSLRARGHTIYYHTCDTIMHELNEIGFQTVPSFRQFTATLLPRSLKYPVGPTTVFEATLKARFGHISEYFSYLREDLLYALQNVQPDVLLLDAVKDWRLIRGCDDFARTLGAQVSVVRLSSQLGCHRWPPALMRIPLAVLCPKQLECRDQIDALAVYGEPSVFRGFGTLEELDLSSFISKPIVYITFGSQAGEYPGIHDLMNRILVLASLESRYNYVITSSNSSRLNKPEVSSNVYFVPHYAHRAVLRGASAMICHGGLGSIKDAVDASVPMLIVPQKWDQHANARRVVVHSLGTSIAPCLASPESLKTALNAIMSSQSIDKGLKEMKAHFEACRTSCTLVNFCEDAVR